MYDQSCGSFQCSVMPDIPRRKFLSVSMDPPAVLELGPILLLAYYCHIFGHLGHISVPFLDLLYIVIKNIAEAFPPTFRDQDGVAEVPLDLRD